MNALIGQLFQFAFFGGILVLFVGGSVLPPVAAAWVTENRGTFMFGVFVCNMLSSSLLQTGAFEVFLDDKLVFSKLQAGGVPHIVNLLQIIRDSLRTAATQ